jgi:hypothetical protein
MQTISDTLNHMHLGEATAFEGMTVFPLFSDQLRDKDYLTLDEALEQGQARVIEVSEEGDVPNLLFENLGSRKVLLVDGDELVGAKQNRIVNLSILVAAHTKIEIPVSCVEAGRWSRKSDEFSSAKRAMYSRARASKAEAVTVRMRCSGERYSDQSEVWNNIAECSADLDVDSLTSSMSDIYESHEQRLGRYREAFKAQDGQVGALFAINGKPQGLELFDSSETFSHYLDRLVSSYALGFLAEVVEGKEATLPEIETFMASVKAARAEQFEALGEGEDLRLSGESLAGGALVAEDRVVHLAAFNLDSDSKVVRRYPHRWLSDEER